LDEKAIAAQVRQLIAKNIIEREGGDIAYNFSDRDVVKKFHVTQEQLTGLASGRIAVARYEGAYALIAAPVAAKIIERDPGAVVVMNTPTQGDVDADDPYSDYQIPDDLMW